MPKHSASTPFDPLKLHFSLRVKVLKAKCGKRDLPIATLDPLALSGFLETSHFGSQRFSLNWYMLGFLASLLSETELPALGDGEGNKDIEDGNFNCQVTCIFETA